MTIATTTAKSRYAGDGGTTSFPTGFKFLDNDHVRVILLQSDGSESLWTEGSEYSLSGAGAPGGGTVTVSTSPSDFTPQSGEILVVKLAIPAEQQTALPLGGAFPSTAVEGMADLAALRDQQIEEALSRAPKFRETTALADVEFPEPEAGKVARWNATGDALENSTLPTFFDGSGAPAASLGEIDDRYIDNDMGDFYRKTSASVWTLTGNFEGPMGPQGPQGDVGANGVGTLHFAVGVPPGALGNAGDYYKNTDNGDYYQKTGADSWALEGNDTGPPGPQGEQGIQGIQGNPGTIDGVDTKTANYTLLLGDVNRLLRFTGASAKSLTVPSNGSVAFAVGDTIYLSQDGAGQVTVVAGAGVTVVTADTLLLRANGSGAGLIKVGTDRWQLFGDLQAP